jgi:hypothetical protein
VQVGNAAGTALSSNAVLTVIEPSVITSQPSALAIVAGADATFVVAATGSAPLSYQWLLNGVALAGATESIYTRTNVQTADVGNYSVQVANAAGTSISSNALMTVNNPPVLAAIKDQVVHAGTVVLFTNTASHLDSPAQILTFSLDPGCPCGATIDSGTGVFEWRTTPSQAGTTNPITVGVSGDGTPVLSDARSFTITVVAAPIIQSIVAGTSKVTISRTTIPGTTYRVEYKESPSDSAWITLPPDIIASASAASITDPVRGLERLYRVSAIP